MGGGGECVCGGVSQYGCADIHTLLKLLLYTPSVVLLLVRSGAL